MTAFKYCSVKVARPIVIFRPAILICTQTKPILNDIPAKLDRPLQK